MQRTLVHAAGSDLQLKEKKGLLRKNLKLQQSIFLATSVFDGKERLNERLDEWL